MGGIGVVDGHDHVALGGDVLGDIGEQHVRAGVAVRDDEQRVRARACVRLGVTQGAARELERDDRAAGGGGRTAAEGVVVGGELWLLAVPDRRVPDLHRQRAVVGGTGVRGSDVDHVELVGIGEREPAHADVERAAGGKLRRVRTHVAGHRVAEIGEAGLAGRRLLAAARAAGERVAGHDRAGRGGGDPEHRAADEELAPGEPLLVRRFARAGAKLFWMMMFGHSVSPFLRIGLSAVDQNSGGLSLPGTTMAGNLDARISPISYPPIG